MLNITEKQVQQFEDWKTKLSTNIQLMQDVVRKAVPDGYEKNDFYRKLKNILTNIDDMEISTEKVTYNKVLRKIDISTSFDLGRYVLEYWQSIEITDCESGCVSCVLEIMAQAKHDLFAIFKDL